MSYRLEQGGRLIDRGQTVKFTFNGRWMRGFAGDTLASALLANDQMLVGRSFKYHRPRGIVASGAEEPNALVNLGRRARHEPNQRATTTEVYERLEARSQNHWPSLAFDVGAVNAMVARFLPAGFYYKTFIHPRAFWKHVFEPIIRNPPGWGRRRTPRRATRIATSILRPRRSGDRGWGHFGPDGGAGGGAGGQARVAAGAGRPLGRSRAGGP